MKLIIGNRAYSSWSMRAWLALKAAEVEFDELIVPIFSKDWDKQREGNEFAASAGGIRQASRVWSSRESQVVWKTHLGLILRRWGRNR